MLQLKSLGGNVVCCCYSPFSWKARELAKESFPGVVGFLIHGLRSLPRNGPEAGCPSLCLPGVGEGAP